MFTNTIQIGFYYSIWGFRVTKTRGGKSEIWIFLWLRRWCKVIIRDPLNISYPFPLFSFDYFLPLAMLTHPHAVQIHPQQSTAVVDFHWPVTTYPQCPVTLCSPDTQPAKRGPVCRVAGCECGAVCGPWSDAVRCLRLHDRRWWRWCAARCYYTTYSVMVLTDALLPQRRLDGSRCGDVPAQVSGWQSKVGGIVARSCRPGVGYWSWENRNRKQCLNTEQ